MTEFATNIRGISMTALVVTSVVACVSDRDVTLKKQGSDGGSDSGSAASGSGGEHVGSGGAPASGGRSAGGSPMGDGAVPNDGGRTGSDAATRDGRANDAHLDSSASGATMGDAGGDTGTGGQAGAKNTGGTSGAGGKGGGGTGGGGSVCTPMAKRCMNNGVETCNQAGSAWGNPVMCMNQACVTNACTGVCTPSTYRCTNNIGQRCGAMGNYVSNGSTDTCNCYVPGRFVNAGTNLVLDTTTSLVWESAMRSPANYPTASTTCDGLGMRLPTYAEWQGILLLSQQGTANCAVGAVPFDQAAMPTSTTELGGTSVANLWTGDAEPGFPGYVYVVFLGQSGTQWGTSKTDAATTMKIPYRCVK